MPKVPKPFRKGLSDKALLGIVGMISLGIVTVMLATLLLGGNFYGKIQSGNSGPNVELRAEGGRR